MLIATDLDGTLIPNAATEVPAFTARVLRRLDRQGVPVVFVTGRPLRWMDGLWPHVGTHGLAIASNGAITFSVPERKVVHLSGIEPTEGLALCDRISQLVPGAQFAIECVDGIRLDQRYPALPPQGHDVPRAPLRDIWDAPAAKLLVRHPNLESADFHSQMTEAVGHRATLTWSVSGLAEISARGVTKASALAELCRGLNVSTKDVVAFGDMPNDIAMLTWAGTAFAVADAHESVRAVAHEIVPSCAEEGVARTLDRLVR
ncbi:HMP-PP hydrolase (pyridoxal phosphatase) Cof, detected in genetic screen for thiamin metabolic genes (PMID:15292217) [Microbacterium esteraromaticum]|uniref:HMP-PP hydrolase (Pyridoxal phosphatase) Cof, detected in genetic screen for thiamin metabolic genes (PMID:15292217) n=1 Tax=Microbacterium esteraromaticum TaxID=57043 RepID=A0A1R4INJ2_9MICO|nr:HAD-IIB family hydrolase [Microbacterium esteraromaticum]SJN21450.1 HMP-PP hydrolase (pyridoxal phosphatase) Cof, detected in genetic screen for thiamin metabolic genes (PMID:15292217) [Microbacterium esteraromaticum]